MSSSMVTPVPSTTPKPQLSHPLDSPYDHRSVLEVVGWCMAIMATLVLLARMGTKWSISRRLEIDDILITTSLLLAFGQTASLSSAVRNGLGLLSSADQSPVNIDDQQKSMYAFNVLFIVSQCFAKVSVTVFIGRLTPVKLHRQLCKALVFSISIWAAVAIVTLLFQCQMPRPWQAIGGKCINRVALYTYVEVVNAILDVVLVAIPVTIVWSLNQTKARKLAVMATFLTRTAVIAVIIAQLVVLHKDLGTGPDPFLRWNFALCTQFIEYLSIVSACALYLRPFLQSAASGMLSHTAPKSPRQQYYHQFYRDRFAKARSVVITAGDPRTEFWGKLRPQQAESTLNITVQKDFEMYENIAGRGSASSGQSSHVTMERETA